MIKDEQCRELLRLMDEISSRMREEILLKHFDKYEKEKKYIFSMFVEAYQNVQMICYGISKAAVGQAGMLLRQLLEQTAIVYILVEHPETLPKYIEFTKHKKDWINIPRGEQIKKIAELYNVPPKRQIAFNYLDYGWLGFDDLWKCNEDGMIEYAGLKDILPWRKVYLDKLAHSSFTTIDLIGDDYSFPIVKNFIQIACKLFDHLCVAFHNLTNFSFVFDGEELFQQFRALYSSIDF